MVETAARSDARGEDTGPIDVQFAIRPPTKCNCPLVNENISTVKRSADGEKGPEDDCRLVIGSGESTAFKTAKIGEQCLCPIFDDHDCVWEIVKVGDGQLHFAATLPDRDILPPLMTELENAGASVTTERVHATRSAVDDEGLLTSEQREAFVSALRSGYYERPRKTTLAELGEQLEISKSAVSKRLTAARNRIMKQYADQYDGSD